MPLPPLAKTVAEPPLVFALSYGAFRTPVNHPEGDFNMKSTMIVKAAAVAVVVALAGCTDLKPIQAQIDDLKSQVSKLQSEVQGANSAAAQASSQAQSASTAAAGAQSTANQALAAAQAAQAAVDATNEKIDRMFKRSISK
jgi:outer membrane murein-binding lipoprotein Lpp